MLKFLLFLLFLCFLILLFFPFKLRFRIILSEEDLEIKLFKFQILSLNKILGSHKEETKISKEDKQTKAKKKSKKKGRLFKAPSNKILLKFIKLISKSRFKPSLKADLNMSFSTEDAALTAIFYGIIHEVLAFLNTVLINFFNIKKLYQNIEPNFKERNFLLFEVKGIITINFAQIIYIGLLYLLNFKKL